MIENAVCQINIASALWVFAVPMFYSLTHVIPTELIRELSHTFHHHPIPVIRQCPCPNNCWVLYNLWLPDHRSGPQNSKNLLKITRFFFCECYF